MKNIECQTPRACEYEGCRKMCAYAALSTSEGAAPVAADVGFVRLSKSRDHGKPYKAWEYAKEQARADLAPAIAALIVRDVCELEPADPDASDSVCVYTGDLEVIVNERLATTPQPAVNGAGLSDEYTYTLAFYGFPHPNDCRVEMCFTPHAPRADGTYADAFYTRSPRAIFAAAPDAKGEK